MNIKQKFLYQPIVFKSLLSYTKRTSSQSVIMSESGAPVENSMRKKLSAQLEPSHLEILNESYMHNVPKGSETHFKVVIVSEKFTDLTLIKRHRLVNDALKYELENGVHALSIMAKTPNQWVDSDQQVEPSPNCRGGFGK